MSVSLAPGALWELPGQERAATVLAGAVARDEVGHAWAFLGPPGLGQEQASRALAAATNCPASAEDPGGADGTCDACRRALRGVHPAYREFRPEGAFHHKKAVTEQWLRAAWLTAAEGRTKVLRVVQADRMNDEAANAFLKGLEEPPPGTVWILDVSDPDELPDTILSRCRTLAFAPWDAAAMTAEALRLGLEDPDERALAVRAAQGSPATLRRLAAPGGIDDLRAHRSWFTRVRLDGPGHALVASRALEREVARRTEAVRAEGRAALDDLATTYGELAKGRAAGAGGIPKGVLRQVEERSARAVREIRVTAVQAALDDLVSWCRDCLAVPTAADPGVLIHADALDELRADTAALPASAFLEAADLALRTRDALEVNVAPTLAIESLVLALHALTVRG